LGNKLVKTAILILVSIVSTTLIFFLLTYTGLVRRILKTIMPIFGLNPLEGGSGEKYDLHFILGIIASVFIGVFILSNHFLFRKKN
jgi:uncharacterized iron-regulated membrane protein